MARNSYSERVNIIKYVKTGAAWRFAPVAKTSNGNVHWNYVVIDGKEEHHPEGNYFIEWRENGGRRRKSVGAIPSDVLAEAQRKRAAMNAQAAGIEIVPEDPAASALYLKDAVEKYLNEIEMNRARSTFIHYRHTLDLFKQSCRKPDVRKIGRDDIMEYEKFLRDRGLGAHTIRNKTIVVLSFLNTLGVEDLITGRDLPDFTPREIETYSIDQLQKFFFACTDEENLTFQFFLHTGARDQEVRHTVWSDIDFDLGIVRVTRKEKTRSRAWKFQPKGKAVRSIPVPDSLLKILRDRAKTATGELVFPSPAHWKSPTAKPGGKPTDHFLEMCKGVAHRALLNCGRCVDGQGRTCAAGPRCEKFYLHKFRHTFATMHLRSGVDILTVSNWLGHKDVKTTMVYLQALRASEVRQKVNAGLLVTALAPASVPVQAGSKSM
jgi:integrase/recombinase XerD